MEPCRVIGYGQMNAPIEIVNPLEYADWDDLVIASGDYSFFHSSSWARVLHESYNYKPVYLASVENGRLSVLVPAMEIRSLVSGRRGVSLPFSDYCEPIADGRERLETAMERLIEYGRHSGWKFIELRGEGYFRDGPPWPYHSFYFGHVLLLSRNEENMAREFRDSTGRNIQKALKQGVKTEICTSAESIEEFYRIHCITRKLHGVPPQPPRFFRKVYEHVISAGKGIVVLASYGGKYIAGSVFFHVGDRAVYKFGASDRRYQQLRASNLVMWEAIRWYGTNGYESLCFGRTSSDAPGLRQFKNGWGAEERTMRYYRYDLEKERFSGESSSQKVWQSKLFQNLPIPLLKVVGLLLYRHMG